MVEELGGSTRRRSVGMGCMRLSTDSKRDGTKAIEALRAAIDAGVNLFDTAPSYGLGEADQHHNERLVSRALKASGAINAVRVVTKGGLIRVGTKWVTDGRAKSLRLSCERSLDALSVPVIDLFLLHAPDPRTAWSTSIRTLAALKRDGLVRAIGVSNVSLAELDFAIAEASIDAVEIALGAFDDACAKSGVLGRAIEKGLEILAHSPLGGPKRARRLARDPVLAAIAKAHRESEGTIVLAWLYGLTETLVPLPGATRVQTAQAAARASTIELSDAESSALDERFPSLARSAGRSSVTYVPRDDTDVVLIMGIQGGGKSSRIHATVNDGYERLNRDERGGTLRGIARLLDERLAAGGRRFVLDNTYGTRTSRADVIDVARDRGANVRCVWIDTPIERAQVQAILRLVERYGSLPAGTALADLSKTDPHAFFPTTQWKFRRELEPPSLEEGFSSVERIANPATKQAWEERVGIAIDVESFDQDRVGLLRQNAFADSPILVFGWSPGASPEQVPKYEMEGLTTAICTHPPGPPTCWCRPPLPGLLVTWARERHVDLASSVVIGKSPAHRALAKCVGAAFRTVGES